jgi:hypothetical protein
LGRKVGDRLEPAGLVVEVSEIVVHEAGEPEMVVDLLDADGLPAKTWLRFTLRRL